MSLNWKAGLSGLLLFVVAGCGGGNELGLVDAGGIVTLDGQPFANALVMFQPKKGPFAVGQTDAEGKFTLTTGVESGVVTGECRITVEAQGEDTGEPVQKKIDPRDPANMIKAMAPMIKGANRPRELPEWTSPIPEKYRRFETSGLKDTVSEDPAENDFKIELSSQE